MSAFLVHNTVQTASPFIRHFMAPGHLSALPHDLCLRFGTFLTDAAADDDDDDGDDISCRSEAAD